MKPYRWRTKTRSYMPWALVRFFPKGVNEDKCDHEWYRETDHAFSTTWACYHCVATRLEHHPVKNDWAQRPDPGQPRRY